MILGSGRVARTLSTLPVKPDAARPGFTASFYVCNHAPVLFLTNKTRMLACLNSNNLDLLKVPECDKMHITINMWLRIYVMTSVRYDFSPMNRHPLADDVMGIFGLSHDHFQLTKELVNSRKLTAALSELFCTEAWCV
jgi:hypothetical protein